MPRPVAEAGAAMCGHLAVELSAERRLLIERNLHRAAGADADRVAALRRAVHRDLRLLHALLGRLVPAADAVAGADRRRLRRSRATTTSDGPWRRAPGAILALPHLGGWEWAAYWLTQVQGVAVTVVVEAVEPPELFDFFVDFRRELGMHVVAARPARRHRGDHRHQAGHMSSACCPIATSPVTASRSSSSASARRCPVARSRSPCGPARRCCRPRSTSRGEATTP